MDFRIPEPCSPVNAATYFPSRNSTRARRKYLSPLLFCEALLHLGPDGPAIDVSVSPHLEYRGADKLLEGDHGGHGVSRQAEEGLPLQQAEGQRAPGPHGHAPELDAAADLGHDVLHEIVVPHGDPARGDDDVGPGGCPEPGKQVLPGIPGDPHLKRDAARLQDQGRQRVAVAVHDLSRPGRLVDLHQLIARGDDGHDGPLVHAHVGAAQGGKHPDLGGAKNSSLWK